MGKGTDAVTVSDKPIIDQIEARHREAVESAGRMVLSGLACGRLLTIQKTALPHGSFGQWLDVQLSFTARTAQRYMKAWVSLVTRFPRIAERFGAGASEATKYDTVSYLPEGATEALGVAGVDAAMMPSIKQLTGETRSTPPAAQPTKPPQIPPAESGGPEPQSEAQIPVRLPKASPVDKGDLRPNVERTLADGRAACEAIMRELNAIATRLEQIAAETDWLSFAHVQTFRIGLDAMRRQIRSVAPHAPCHHCEQKGCRICKPTGAKRGLGWLPRDRFEMDPDKLKIPGAT